MYFVQVNNNKRVLRLSVLEFVAAISIFILSIVLFSEIAEEIVLDKNDQFDIYVYQLISSYKTNWTTGAALFITNFGSGYFLIPAYLIILFICVKKGRKQQAIIVASVALISLLSGLFLKHIFQRARPSHPLNAGTSGFSFPSGHSIGGFTFSGILIYMIWKSKLNRNVKWAWTILLIFFSCLIGLSRIYLNVHYASDVMGSFFLTLIWLAVTFHVAETLERRAKSI